MEKTYSQHLIELKKYRKILYKIFVEKETGDKFQLVTFSLEYSTKALCATLVLSAHTPYKLTIPMRAFKAAFMADSPDTKEIQDALDATTT